MTDGYYKGDVYCKRMRNRTIDQTDVILETVKCFISIIAMYGGLVIKLQVKFV